MPKSKLRKGHKKKVANRKVEIQNRKNHAIKKFRQQMSDLQKSQEVKRDLHEASAKESKGAELAEAGNESLKLPELGIDVGAEMLKGSKTTVE